MENNKFEMILQVISAGLIEKIIIENKIDENIAIHKLYSSKLYAVLENEKNKVWHYSVHKLFEIWEKEQKTGNVLLPAF